EKGRIPFLARLRRESGESRVWSAVLTPALRKPLVSAAAATAVLLTLALPGLSIPTTPAGFEALPEGIPTGSTIERLQKSFPGNVNPAIVAIKADTNSRATVAAINRLKTAALASGQMRQPIQVDVNPSHTVARVAIPLVGKGTDARSV